MRAVEFIVEAVSRADSIDHLRQRVRQVVQLLEPIADHPLVYREFRHNIGAETAVLKVSNDRKEFTARSGSNPKQPELLRALGITNPVFCTMQTPSTTQGFFGGANIFVPGAGYRVFWSPVVKDLGGNDVVGPDAERYGLQDLGNGVSKFAGPDRQVGAEFADTYQSGWPPEYTSNELIFDCESYYLLNIKDFLRRFAGRQNREIINPRARYADINQEVFNAKFSTYGDIVWYLSNTLPKYLDWYEANVVAENFADKKVKGKSRPGRVKRAGASCKGSVSSLRAKAKRAGGERGKMYHWCANMKAGRAKNESELDEDWRSALAGVATAGAMALGGADDVEAKSTVKPATVAKAPAKSAKPVAPVHKPVSKQAQAKMTPIEKLKTAASANGIHGTELAQFLAQCAHESANFTRMEEIGSSKYFAKKYDPKYAPKTAKILGNTEVGDGERYKGRGFIQLTGRENYQRAGKALGLPLEANPELAARPDVAAVVAVWYWKTRVANKVKNFANTRQATKAINPAMKGIDDRMDKFKQFQVAMR